MTYVTALLADWRVFAMLWLLHLGYSSWLSALLSSQQTVPTNWVQRSFWWKLGIVAALFWFSQSVITEDTTGLQAMLSACVLIALLRTAYKIGHWNGSRDRSQRLRTPPGT
jgi:hypothetical protein